MENNTKQIFFKHDRPYPSNALPNIDHGTKDFESYEGALAGFAISM